MAICYVTVDGINTNFAPIDPSLKEESIHFDNKNHNDFLFCQQCFIYSEIYK